MTERFGWLPSFGAQASREPRIRSARFGDGYEQRAAVGLNADLAMWTLNFENRSDAEASSIAAFLAARGGHEAFEWIAPGESWTVTESIFGTGNGTRTAWDLVSPYGDTINELTGEPIIYRTDWQGKQRLYSAPRTNLCPYSQALASWTQIAVTLGSAVAAPDGTMTAMAVIPNTTSGLHYVIPPSNAASVNGSIYTVSAFVKPNGYNYLYFQGDAAFGFMLGATFNLATGTVDAVQSGISATITPVAGGYFRISITGKVSGTVMRPGFAPKAAGGTGFPSFAGDGVSGCIVWGVQIEEGSTATSYIPTTTAAASQTDYTRTASTITLSVAPLSAAVLSWTGTGAWVKKWVCRKWRRSVPNYGVASISADFEQVVA